MLKLQNTQHSSFLGKIVIACSVFTVCYAAASFFYSSVILPGKANAATTGTTTVSATVASVASISLTGQNSQNLPSVTPDVPGSTTVSKTTTPVEVSITTNSGSYKLYAVGSYGTSYTNAMKTSSGDTINSIATTNDNLSSKLTSANFTEDCWGYSTDGGSNWRGVGATAAQPSLVAQGTTNGTVQIYFGVRISTNVKSGTYSNKVYLGITPTTTTPTFPSNPSTGV